MGPTSLILMFATDLPPMMFIKKAPNSHGWVNPKDVEELWVNQFDYFYREEEDFGQSYRCHLPYGRDMQN